MPRHSVLLCTQRHRLIAVAFSVIALICIVVLAFLLAKNHNHHHRDVPPDRWKGEGTTANLYEILQGRCYDYITTVNPAVGYKDCSRITWAFGVAVIQKNQCNITAADYRKLLEMTNQPVQCDKSLFWSKTYDLVHRYSKVARDIVTLEDTMLGYIASGLTWCGKPYSTELNYESCPLRTECENNPVSTFWKTASEHFARQACGVVYLMLNGSTTKGAVQPNSIFRSIEVPSLDHWRISEVRIWVMDNVGGPDRDSCSSQNVTGLVNDLKERNISTTCMDNYWPVRTLQCIRSPNDGDCKSVNRYSLEDASKS